MTRDRLMYAVAGCGLVALGLASRRFGALLPAFVAQYAGDTLWALMVFIALGVVVPRWSSLRLAITALAVSYLVEVSQLYHANWIDSVRHTPMGGLVLGYGFLWSDILCYTIGVTLGFLVEIRHQTTRARRNNRVDR